MRRLLLAVVTAAAPAAAVAATIYDHGAGTAFIGAGGVAAPGEHFPCVACHMADGMGTREGRMRPADITWASLAAKGYDEAALARALAEGVAPDGRRLDPAMPRYRLASADVAALAGHLRTLGAAKVPGVDGEEIRVATVLPATQTGREVTIVLGAAVAEINRAIRPGGRRLKLTTIPYDEGGAGAALQRALAAEPFCFLANLLPEDDPAVELLTRSGVPDIAPLASALGHRPGRVAVLPSVAAITGRLLEMAPDAVMVHDGAIGRSAAQAFPAVAHHGPPEELAARLRERQSVLLLAGTDYARAFLAAAESIGWRPRVLGLREQLEPLAANAAMIVPANAAMILAAPEPSPTRNQAFRTRIAGMGGSHETLQRAAFTGAFRLADALRAIGRPLTREAVAASLPSEDEPRVSLWVWDARANRLVPLEAAP